ncbi:MAG TPA: methyltransferase domain-containing protein [Usitatibacter sp.]
MNILVRKVRSAFIRARGVLYSQRFGFDPAGIYAKSFYEDGGFIRTERSAEVIAAWATKQLGTRSLLDLGAGAGYYLRAFSKMGVEVFGLEASPEGVKATGTGALALAYDLKRPVHLSRTFDTVMCVEVAEHIPKKSSATLVASICANSSRFVLFTAAPPGTPGVDHINCREGSFWHGLFASHGFQVRDDLTHDLRSIARANEIAEWWFSWAWCLEKGTGPSSDRKFSN